jgi:hypothetical protein
MVQKSGSSFLGRTNSSNKYMVWEVVDEMMREKEKNAKD